MIINYLTRQLAGVSINLTAGFRLATGRVVSRRDFIYSLDQGLWLILLLVVLEFLLGYLRTASPMTFDSYGLNYLAALYMVDFLALLLMARIAGAGLEVTGCLFIANFAVSPVFMICFEIIHQLNFVTESESWWSSWGLYILIMLWQLVVLAKMLRLHLPLKRIKASLLAGLNTSLAFAAILGFPQSELWYTDSDPQADSPYAKLWQLSIEDIFYSQYPIMDDALSRISAHREGITDLYLLAFAGYGYEKVFLNEVEYVQQLFDRKFDTRNRSLILANNAATLDKYPLANRHNLTDALSAIGDRMDLEEDVLFLFMTSHGSKDHKLSVDFGPIRMDNLKPQQVKEALDEAGIRWRVVLVSSCYSGGFVKPLQDSRTLVITAAAPDRQSFGCGSQSEFTDFGDATLRKGWIRRLTLSMPFMLQPIWLRRRS